jgi:hypothetical protein
MYTYHYYILPHHPHPPILLHKNLHDYDGDDDDMMMMVMMVTRG